MSIILVGLNHKTAPVEVRERLAFSETMLSTALRMLVDSGSVSEAIIVSTCNRVEIVASAPTESNVSVPQVCRFLHEFHHLPGLVYNNNLYTHADRLAVRHLFRVAASLDSMVLGESQVLGQVKTAYSKAQEVGTVGRVLNQLLTRAFTVAKRIRTETEIGNAATSVSSVAIELTKKIFDRLDNKRVLLVGAGEMTELAARYLVNEGVSQFLICNRTPERATELCEKFGGEVIEFSQLKFQLPRADIVICSTGASEYIISQADCKKALEIRRYRPIFFIDLSVPRNIDPNVGQLESSFLFDIDDLENVVSENLRQRQKEAAKAESIVETEVEAFFEKLDIIEIGPTVAALKEHLTEIVLSEFERTRPKLGNLTPQQEEAIKQHLLGSLVNKFMHPLITTLKEGTRNNKESCNIVELYHEAYNLKGRVEGFENRRLGVKDRRNNDTDY
ncbi:MAG: glutamyl-tRNA reductase [Acidobacteria bacterium]|nr:glutamyl-tRNA reductase [Acidobacteriota bacterium]